MITYRLVCDSFLVTITIVLLFCTLGIGCVWRGETNDYYIGPLLFGVQESGVKAAGVNEQVHFPALIESGRQWGISLGILRHITASPRIIDANRFIKTATTERPYPFFSIPITRQLALSPVYLRIDRQTRPELRIRSLVGFQWSVGDEGNFLSAGLSSTREFVPLQNGTYVLCHDSRRPLETTFLVYKSEAVIRC